MTTLEPIGNPVEWLAEQSIRMTTALRKISKVVQRAADSGQYMSAIADIDDILAEFAGIGEKPEDTEETP